MGIELCDIREADVESVQALIESVPDFSERITGHPPGPSDALSALIGCPPGFEIDDKLGVGLRADGELVAFADVLLGYPTTGVAHIGLLIVRGDRQRQGHGRALHDRLLSRLRSTTGVTRTRVGIVATNAVVAEPFWSALAYRPTGEDTPYRYDKLESSLAIWERDLTGS